MLDPLEGQYDAHVYAPCVAVLHSLGVLLHEMWLEYPCVFIYISI